MPEPPRRQLLVLLLGVVAWLGCRDEHCEDPSPLPSCSERSGALCVQTAGCRWSTGCTPVICNEARDEWSCKAAPQCRWQLHGDDAGDVVEGVCTQLGTSLDACGATTDETCRAAPGCRWVPRCAGTPESCGGLSAEHCSESPHAYCNWSRGISPFSLGLTRRTPE